MAAFLFLASSGTVAQKKHTMKIEQRFFIKKKYTKVIIF
jgi:hypothetical protein